MIGLLLIAMVPTPVAVVPIVVAGREAGVPAKAIVSAIDAAVDTRVTLRMISSEEIFVAGSSLEQELADCAAEVSCIAARLRVTSARLVLVAVVNQSVQPALVSVELLDVDIVKSVGRAITRIEDPTAIAATLERQADTLLSGAAFPASCRLRLNARPDHASITIDGATLESPWTIVVSPGAHEAVAIAEGYETATRSVRCAAGMDERADVVLFEDRDLLSSPWLWGAVGAMVVAGVVASVLVFRPDAPCLCVGPPGAPCSTCP